MRTSRSFVALSLVLAAVHQLAAPVLAQRQCPNGGLLCASGQVCCPGVDGTQFCAASAAACPCTYAGNCPTRNCCTQEYTGTQGQCTNQVFDSVSGTQVCTNCRDLNGLTCPATTSFCCPDGSCASSGEACSCGYSGQCPTGYCCTTESYEAGGHCTRQAVLPDGTQVCPNCNSFNGASCLDSQVCCPTGACASDLEACSCSYYFNCPTGYCCTTYGGEGGHCSSQPVLGDGTQVCPYCNLFQSNGVTCPGDQVCCPNGSCASDLEACGCTYQGECALGYCCTTQTGEPGGHCTSQAVLADGTQVCPNCNSFNGLTCPDDQLCCPASGRCAATPAGCTCNYFSSDCPFGSCCIRDQGDGNGGRCTEQVIQPGGTQSCPDCRDFVVNGLSCPENGVCCRSGKCAKTTALCNTATGGYDPHFELTGLTEGNEKLTFDFHGEPNKTFCMISDATLQINVHMFGLTKSTKVLKERMEDVESFFEGTWMDGLGFLYIDRSGEQQNIGVTFDAALDRAGMPPFGIFFNGKSIGFDGTTTWSSPDGIAKIKGIVNRKNALAIFIEDLLELEMEGDFEKELIADPPIHFINFKINKLATGPSVHGFLGQMYAPGAVEERISMGTLEGLLHREYVEGTDEEYETPSLTNANCSFTRFGQALREVINGPQAIGDNSMPFRVDSVPRRLLAVQPIKTPMEACHLEVSFRAGKGLTLGCQ